MIALMMMVGRGLAYVVSVEQMGLVTVSRLYPSSQDNKALGSKYIYATFDSSFPLPPSPPFRFFYTALGAMCV
jgi:hypothetical protein